METIEIKNLTFSYPDEDEKALNDISFSLPEGSFTLLVGQSGSGKTTFIKMLKNAISPIGNKSGSIKLFGMSPDKVSFDRVGYVAQSPEGQLVTDKVWHELAFGLENMGLASEEIRLRVGETASYFGIGGWYHRSTDTLSGGQKQLLNLASNMVMRPQIILLDEPTSQLDPIAASNFFAMLKKINRELGVTILLSEHRLEEVFPLADRVIVLEKGGLAANGSPDEVCLALRDNPVYSGFPTAARLWKDLGCEGDCPLSVKAGREFLEKYYSSSSGETAVSALPDRETVVDIKDLYFRYDRASDDVISGLSLKIGKGEIFAVLGENGSGKSSLLRII